MRMRHESRIAGRAGIAGIVCWFLDGALQVVRSGGAGLAFNPIPVSASRATLQSPHGKSLMPSDGDTISFNPRAISTLWTLVRSKRRARDLHNVPNRQYPNTTYVPCHLYHTIDSRFLVFQTSHDLSTPRSPLFRSESGDVTCQLHTPALCHSFSNRSRGMFQKSITTQLPSPLCASVNCPV